MNMLTTCAARHGAMGRRLSQLATKPSTFRRFGTPTVATFVQPFGAVVGACSRAQQSEAPGRFAFSRSAMAFAAACVASGCAALVPEDGGARCEKVYESCDTIGDGLKGEIWKARHQNIEILELENSSIQLLMTQLRDRTVSDKLYTFYADRLLMLLVETAISHLPTEDYEVETPDGHRFRGIRFAGDTKNLCGITITHDAGLMVDALKRSIPDLSLGYIYIQEEEGNTDKKEVKQVKFPAGMATRQVILLDPVVGRGRSLQLAIEQLKAYGVPEENIFVVTITMSPGAADALKKYSDVNIITASIESGLGKDGRLVPGIGHFQKRYESEMDICST